LHQIDHTVDRGAVEGGAFGDDPAPDAFEHGGKINGILRRHGTSFIELPMLCEVRTPHQLVRGDR
jgi:hypothetical protein